MLWEILKEVLPQNYSSEAALLLVFHVLMNEGDRFLGKDAEMESFGDSGVKGLSYLWDPIINFDAALRPMGEDRGEGMAQQ